MVVCTGFRNPALTAKLSSTIDVISGGRFELGIGAGWKRTNGSPTAMVSRRWRSALMPWATTWRSSARCSGPDRSSYEGAIAHVRGAINVPRGLQEPRIPIIVGGNGRQRTAGYAIRYADELNFVFIEPDDIVERMRDVRERCRG
jgi:alkanesulfonate monooxygenase SsuD/methylene tetrahydromethanopterin reductase-like flavin-dependent oxidoreductase (luciferase family)